MCKLFLTFSCIAEKIKAKRVVWIIGDNFVASSYRNHFKKVSGEHLYTKKYFQVEAYCSSRFSDSNGNMISWLQISMAQAINKSTYLPDYIIIVLEDDIIEYLEYRNYGVSAMYGTWLEWLAKEFNELLHKKQALLPIGAKNDDETQIYWTTAVYHKLFTLTETQMREKFNNCMESVVQAYGNMRVIKVKEAWGSNNMSAVMNNRITSTGLSLLWKGIDAAFKFNVQKHNEYLIREKYREQQANKDLRKSLKCQKPSGDDIPDARFERPEIKMQRMMTQFFR